MWAHANANAISTDAPLSAVDAHRRATTNKALCAPLAMLANARASALSALRASLVVLAEAWAAALGARPPFLAVRAQWRRFFHRRVDPWDTDIVGAARVMRRSSVVPTHSLLRRFGGDDLLFYCGDFLFSGVALFGPLASTCLRTLLCLQENSRSVQTGRFLADCR